MYMRAFLHIPTCRIQRPQLNLAALIWIIGSYSQALIHANMPTFIIIVIAPKHHLSLFRYQPTKVLPFWAGIPIKSGPQKKFLMTFT